MSFRQTLWPLSPARKRVPLQQLQALLTAFPDSPARFLALCERIPRWDWLFTEAERHGVAGLLHRALRQTGYVLPQQDRRAIERRAAAGRLQQQNQLLGMRRVLEGLEKAGVEVVALKGPVLAERLYGDPLLRYSSDLDLLIPPSQLEAVSAILKDLGFFSPEGPTRRYERAHTHNLSFFHAEFPLVEVHFHLLVAFGVTISATDFLRRSLPCQALGGVPCRILGPEDEAFYLILHAVHHEFARFSWSYDIWTLLQRHPELRWEVIRQRAEQYGVREPFFYAVELLQRRLGVAPRLPQPPLQRRIRHAVANFLLRIYDQLTPLDSPSTLVNLFFKAVLCDRPSSSVQFLGHNLWRMTRRRLQRYLPQVVPEEWSG